VPSKKTVKRRAGDVVRIDLGDGTHSHAVVLREPLMAFFGSRSDREASVQEVGDGQILFAIWVMSHAVTSGRWPVVGQIELTDAWLARRWFCKQDPISKKLSIYSEGEELPATFEECQPLERAAVWSPEHVEDRLRDHFAGRPNKRVESLRLRSPS
jgi:Immunity protein 26